MNDGSWFRLARPRRCAGNLLTQPDKTPMAVKAGHHNNSDLCSNKKTLPAQGF